MKNLKFIPTIPAAISTLIVPIIVIILFLGRRTSFFSIPKLNDLFTDFYLHVSNFSISFLILFGCGYSWLLLGINFKFISGLAAFILLSNFVYELFIPLLNTPDLMDAYYGMTGTIAAFLYLFLIKMFGLKPAENH